MALYDEIAALLPVLRRFARVAIGRADAADMLIVSSMEAIADAAIADTPGTTLRYRLFLAVGRAWVGSRVVALRRAVQRQDATAQAVAGTSPVERAALLLVSLERFSAAEAAAILGMSRAEFAVRLADARAAMLAAAPRRVLIIEDDGAAAACLAALVVESGNRVCATAGSEAEAVAAGAEHLPHLLLADVHLGLGGSGAAAAAAILERLPAAVIYVTGYPELIEESGEAPPGMVLAKPFASDALVTAIQRALRG